MKLMGAMNVLISTLFCTVSFPTREWFQSAAAGYMIGAVARSNCSRVSLSLLVSSLAGCFVVRSAATCGPAPRRSRSPRTASPPAPRPSGESSCRDSSCEHRRGLMMLVCACSGLMLYQGMRGAPAMGASDKAAKRSE